ncbi:MAG: ABC transporter ATP-binding protein, partial [Lachnospiraceae bacterium]|nr:ABC transporter ATP-binding protein [Lachnospiraceae bacterium]
MIHIFKNILKHWPFVILIFLLLLAQAYGDLALPQYTSDIIDTGIQNKGIEHIVPEKITKEEYDNAILFMTDNEAKSFSKCYKKDNDYYVIKDLSKDEYELVDESLLLPIVINYQSEINNKREEYLAAAKSGMINDEVILKMRDSYNKMIESVGDSTLESMAIAWVALRETESGVDLDKKQTDYLIHSCFKMILMALLIGVTVIFVSLFAAIVGGRIGRDLRVKVFTKVMSFSNTEMDKFSTASLITRNTNDIQQVQMVSTLFLRMLLYAPILGTGGVIKVYQTGANMGFIIVYAVLIVIGLVLMLLAITGKKFKLLQKQIDRINLVAREMLTGISVIRAFGRENEIEEKFDKANIELTKTHLFVNRVMSFMMPGMMLIMYGVNIVIVWVSAHRIDEGMLEVGTMTAFLTYSIQIIMSFLMLSMMS